MINTIIEKLSVQYGPSSLLQYVGALSLIIFTLLVKYIVEYIVYRRLIKWSEGKKKEIIAKFRIPLGYLIFLVGLMLSCQIMTWPGKNVESFITHLFSVLIISVCTWLAMRSIDILSIYLHMHAEKTENKLDDLLVPLISKSLKIFAVIVAAALIIENFGGSITGLLAGIGIGGIALAMAAKDSLANLFGSLTIILDNPFQLGDWIKAGDTEGVVEGIGFRSTRLRTFYKTEVTIPNSVLANMNVDNFSRMKLRRISAVLGLTYETSPEQMEQAIEAIKNVLKSNKDVYQDFFIVKFTEFGESSLNIMLYYFTNTTVWLDYLKVREQVNLSIMKALQDIGVDFAFKSFSVYLRSQDKAKQDLVPPA